MPRMVPRCHILPFFSQAAPCHPFLATPDPISDVYSELGAGPAADLGQSFPERPPHLLQPLWTQGVCPSGLAQLGKGPQPTVPDPGLFWVGQHCRAANTSQWRLLKLPTSCPLPAKGGSVPISLAQKSNSRQSCQDSADPPTQGCEGLKEPERQ